MLGKDALLVVYKFSCSLIFILFLLSFAGLNAQTTIWAEDFNSYPNGTITGTGTGTSPVNWNSQAGAAVNGGLILASNTSNVASSTLANPLIWVTDPINITGFTNVTFSLDVGAFNVANFEDSGGAQDNYTLTYRIDGGGWITVVNASGSAAQPINPSYTITGLSGTSLEIRATFHNTAANENYTIDNVLVQGTPATADSDGDGIPDQSDLDNDNDGIPDTSELNTVASNSQPPCGGETILDFSAAAVLVSGTALTQGAVYRISNITAGTDALVTIVQTFNATVANIDNNSADPASFKPQTAFNFPNVGDQGYIEYRIQFVTSAGFAPVIINRFFMNFNDIDGGANYGEQNWANNPATYTISNPSELTMSTDGSWVIGTAGPNDYPGAGNTFPQVNFSVNYNSKSEMSIRVGAVARVPGASSGGRQHAIEFACITNYVNPVTYGIDTDSDGVANHLDLDADNDGIYDAEEAGHNQPHVNGVVTSAYGANGLADIVETAPESGTLNYTITDTDATPPPNYLDTDSDDDGCGDADEAYYGLIVDADPDNDGFYGSGLPSVDINGQVIGAGYNSVNQYYTNSSINTCADNDNDGIPDGLDFDDDNDGILDTVEDTCPVIETLDWDSSSYDWGENDTSNTYNVGSITVDIVATSNGSTFKMDEDNEPEGGLSPVENVLWVEHESDSGSGTELLTITYTFSSAVNDFQTSIFDIDAKFGDFQDKVTVTGYIGGSPVLPTIVGSANNTVSGNIITGDIETNDTGVTSGNANADIAFSSPIDSMIIEYGPGPSGGTKKDIIGIYDFSFSLCMSADLDGDGLINSFDLDSDGDGCLDVVEAGFIDADADGVLGTSPVSVDANGQVTGQGGYTTPADLDSNSIYDFQESGTVLSITTQPVDQTICDGNNGSFTVVASGTNLTYQWQLSTDGGATFNDLSDGGVYAGTSLATLIITGAASSMNNYQYQVIVGESFFACGVDITSNIAMLTINVSSIGTVMKQLYLSDPSQGLDRVDPVATGDLTTSKTTTITAEPYIDLIASKDTWIFKETPDINYGSCTSISTDRESGGHLRRVLLAFDLTTIPAGTNILSGQLRLNNTFSSGDLSIGVYKIAASDSWTEGTACNAIGQASWNNRAGGQLWSDIGAIGDPGPTPGSFVATYAKPNGQLGIQTWDITTLAQNWFNGSVVNNGVAVWSPDGGGAREVHYDSRETITGTPPVLRLTHDGPAFDTTTFTQSIPVCSPLTIKACEPITITNYISVTDGTMPISPDITATLKYGATAFTTISNPTYNSITGLLTWTQLPVSDITVPAGQFISLTVTTAEPNVSFNIDYDSQTKPSKIEFPVSTYIEITSYDAYDAPYPGGSVITTAETSSLVYLRAVVTDPFGSGDITDLTMDVLGSPVTATSVATSGCTRTYEYEWDTTGSKGIFSSPSTAKEGYENSVTDVENLDITITLTINSVITNRRITYRVNQN